MAQVKSRGPLAPSTLIPAPAPVVTPVVPPPAPVAVVVAPAPPAPTPPPLPVTVVAVPAPPPPSSAPADPKGETLYAGLSRDGRVIVPFVFQPGKDVLEASSQSVVDRVVAMMKNHPDLFLRIEGHTDNSGDAEDNMRLSARRAYAVRAMLVEAEINPKRLDAVGVGGLQPLASNTTAEGREKNRRIELVMWKKYPAFHAPAPNGQNYYPGGGSESASVKPGV